MKECQWTGVDVKLEVKGLPVGIGVSTNKSRIGWHKTTRQTFNLRNQTIMYK
jgi:hypothetical protein